MQAIVDANIFDMFCHNIRICIYKPLRVFGKISSAMVLN